MLADTKELSREFFDFSRIEILLYLQAYTIFMQLGTSKVEKSWCLISFSTSKIRRMIYRYFLIFKLFKNTTLDFGTLISVVRDLFPQPFARSRQQWLKISIAVGAALSFSLQAWDLWSTVKHFCQFCFLIALLHDADLYYTAKTNVVTSPMCSAFLVSVITFLTKIMFWLIVDSMQKVSKNCGATHALLHSICASFPVLTDF